MIRLLAKIGRLSTVIIITLIAVSTSLAATMAAVTLLNNQGYGLRKYGTDSEDSLDDLLARADLALYQARQSGRNQTATFNPQLTQAAAG